MSVTAATLSDLATSRPGASRVFHRHALDFCCGGRRSLAEACHEIGLDAASLLAEIDAEDQQPEDFVRWDERPLGELIDHIVQRYHASLRIELPRLLELARKVENRHGDKESCPRGLGDHLENVLAEVENHLEKEEQVLFPMIMSGQSGFVSMPIQVMLQEHDDHARNIERTRELTANYGPPAEACTSWKALYLGLAELERELKDHMHLENNVLFPRALRA